MNGIHCQGCDGKHLRRRDFLRVGSLTLLGMNLGSFLQVQRAIASTATSKADACILLWLDGGQSQMDTWDPKTTSSFKPISTNVPGIQISELLPRTAQRMNKISVIRSLHTKENDHNQGTHYAATGHSPNPAMKFPGFSSVITKEAGRRNSIPPHVMVPEMPKGKGYVEPFKGHIISAEYDPLVVPDPNQPTPGASPDAKKIMKEYKLPDLSIPKPFSQERLQNRRAFLTTVDRLYREQVESADFKRMDIFQEQAWNMILAPEVREAFDLSKEPDKVKDAYGRDGFGQSVLMARRLVEAGSRFVTAAGYAGQAWDTHGDNDKKHKDDLCPSFDRTFTTLLDDLEQRGLLERTIVLVMGEFGRTPDINFDRGRDHWPECWSVALTGGGIQGGQVIGASDERGAYVADRMISMGDVHATIYKAMGIDWTKEYMHPVGRPVKIANGLNDQTGQPIKELI